MYPPRGLSPSHAPDVRGVFSPAVVGVHPLSEARGNAYVFGSVMRLLYVHERLGALAGAEANVLLTARELALRGHAVGLMYGALTGNGEMAWGEAFSESYPLAGKSNSSAALAALETFSPDVVYVHKMSDLEVLEALAASRVPVVRMVHDHDLYCMRSYKYHYFNRQICRRPASGFCLFPCGSFIARNRDAAFPLRCEQYSAKRKVVRFNRMLHLQD